MSRVDFADQAQIFDVGNTRFGAVQRTDATQNVSVPPASS